MLTQSDKQLQQLTKKKGKVFSYAMFVFLCYITTKFQGGSGHWAVYYTSTQIFREFFLYVGLTTSGTYFEEVIMCIIVGNVHQFIDDCLIPLDPWQNLLTHSQKKQVHSIIFIRSNKNEIGVLKVL